MANRERGELGIEVGGKQYTLRPGVNALCALEDLLDKDLLGVMAQVNQGRLSSTRAVMWCLLQEHHAAEFPTLREAGAFIDKIGVDRAYELLHRVIELNSEPEASTDGNPPDAQAGTGEPSEKTLVGSV